MPSKTKTSYFFSDVESDKFKDDLSEYDMLKFDTQKEKNKLRQYIINFKLACYVEYDFELKQEKETFYSTDQNEYFVKLIAGATRKKRRIVYFHNLTFDSKFIFRYVYNYYDKVDPIYISGKIISIRCFKKRLRMKDGKKVYQFDKVCEFRDSLCLLLSSLKEIGSYVGLEKTEFNFDYSNEKSIREGIEYCFNDCRIIYKGLIHLIDTLHNVVKLDYGIKDLPITIGSLSKKVFKKYYPEVYFKIDTNLEHHLRPYYFGGRTEAFNFNLLTKGYYFDVNSLYPAMLSKNDFSNGKCEVIHCHELYLENELILGYICNITENQHVPLYPERLERIVFANGTKNVFMTRKELLFLTENKMLGKEIIINEIQFAVITNEIIQFKELFEHLYNTRIKYRKINPKHPYVYFIKILMNSSYGKLGERPDRVKNIFVQDLNNVDVDNKEVMDYDGVLMVQEKYQDFNLQINLLNAVLTTSYGRFELWKMMLYCRKNGINVYYCDTDSIVIEASSLDALTQFFGVNELGKWDIELEFEYFQAIDSKEYISVYTDKETNEQIVKIKFKGVAKQYLKEFTQFVNHLNHGTNVNQIGSIFLCYRRHANEQTIFVIKKHKRSFYMKRKIEPDLTTTPVNLQFQDFDDIEKNNMVHIINQVKYIGTKL